MTDAATPRSTATGTGSAGSSEAMSSGKSWPASRILILLVATALLPALLIAGVLLWDIAIIERERRQVELQDRAATMMLAVDQQILDSITVLQVLATSNSLAETDYDALHGRLQKALAGRNAHILLLDSSLNQLINTRVPYGRTLGKTSHPESAMVAAEQRGPYVSPAFHGRVAEVQVFNVVLPVFEGDQASHFLILTRNTSWLRPFLDRTHLPGAGVMLIDQHDQIVATGGGVDPAWADDLLHKMLDGGEQRNDVRTLQVSSGEYFKAVLMPSSTSAWRLLKFVPQRDLDGPLRRSMWLLAGFSLLIVALAAAATLWVARLLTRPLRALARSAQMSEMGGSLPQRSRVLEIDVTAAALAEAAAQRERHDAHVQVLMRELAHRMRNMFTVIEAIFRQVAMRADTLDEFQDSFSSRLQGMARSVGTLGSHDWRAASLTDLIRAHLDQFAAWEGDRVRLLGDDISVNPKAVEAIGLALHELATNSLKYGVLSGAAGTVDIEWGRSGAGGDTFRFTWRERGGPPVTAPSSSGFGSVMLRQVVGPQLNGESDVSYATEGVSWHLECPWSAVTET
ncbi:MAG: sensor histidine kinase [Alphaproteobacteria bacterium]